MADASEHELVPGTRVLRRYQIVGKLAQGGMAEVYLARQVGPGGYQKLVVIKRVRPHLAKDEDFVAMFVNEARLAAMINHPNVVQIFDLGEENGDWFLAMEYLDGRDMLQVGRACRAHNKAVPFDVTARIIADACSGLEYAHNLKGADGRQLDLVHRDMSPENVIITFEGQVKVVDFGIAKAADNAFRTQAGQIKGKLGYVAPEAILGKVLDGRADIFAVGATLYLFLSGRPAFSGTSPMEIFERSLKAPQQPQEVNPRVPPALDQICMKCLAQDRDKRFRTAGEVRSSLDGYLAGTGRPLGAPQLAQFMKILFPPEKDPVRQRIDKLLADAATWEVTNSSGDMPGPHNGKAPATPRTVSVPEVPQYSGTGAPDSSGEDVESTQIVGPEPSARSGAEGAAPGAVDLGARTQQLRPQALRQPPPASTSSSAPQSERRASPAPATIPGAGTRRPEKTVVLDDELLSGLSQSGTERALSRGRSQAAVSAKAAEDEPLDDELDLSFDDGPSATLEGDAEGTAVVADRMETDDVDRLVERLEAQARRAPETGAPRGTEIPPPVAEPTAVTAAPNYDIDLSMPEPAAAYASDERPEPSVVVDFVDAADPSLRTGADMKRATGGFDGEVRTAQTPPPDMPGMAAIASSRGDGPGMGVRLAMLALGVLSGAALVVGLLVATGKLDVVLGRITG